MIEEDRTEPVSEETNDQPDAAEAEAKGGITSVPLGERGPLLALGVPDGAGNLNKSIELREWKGGTMRQLGRKREDHPDLNIAEHVALVLSMMVSRFGPHDFSKMPGKEKRFAISQAYVGDVFFAYCWLRLQALGKPIHIDMVCPACGFKFPWEADLSTLTVDVVDKVEDAYWEYDLIDSIQLRKKEVTRLMMGPAQWHHVEQAQIEGRMDLEGGQLAMVSGIVRGIVGHGEFRLTEVEIDEISGRDIQGIIGEVDNNHVGPDLRIETGCARKGCKNLILQPLDWGYQNFFGSSFRSRTKTPFTTTSLPSSSTREVA